MQGGSVVQVPPDAYDCTYEMSFDTRSNRWIKSNPDCRVQEGVQDSIANKVLATSQTPGVHYCNDDPVDCDGWVGPRGQQG